MKLFTETKPLTPMRCSIVLPDKRPSSPNVFFRYIQRLAHRITIDAELFVDRDTNIKNKESYHEWEKYIGR